jgi:hypothetical protein
MPWFYFDLTVNNHPRDQGGMILEDIAAAQDRADSLANELRITRPELQRKGCYIRVTDGEAREVYRTPVDLTPTWSISTIQK